MAVIKRILQGTFSNNSNIESNFTKYNSYAKIILDFASELMLPKDTFKQAIRDGYNTLEKLSDLFNLSPACIRYRASNLKLI